MFPIYIFLLTVSVNCFSKVIVLFLGYFFVLAKLYIVYQRVCVLCL